MSEQLDELTAQNILRAQTVRGIPPTSRMVPFGSIAELLTERVQQLSDKPFLIHFDETNGRREYTYLEFDCLVNQLANFMQTDLGIRRGDRVATITHNQPEAVMIYFAAWKIGATVAPQNVAEDDQRIAFILTHSNSRVIFVHEQYLDRANQILAQATGPHQVVKLGGAPDSRYPHMVTAAAKMPTSLVPAQPPGLDDECLLVYTSGTTGPPKGVVLTQYNILVDAQANARWDRITDQDRLMCVLPVHHVNGLIVTHVVPLYAGASVVLNRQFSSASFWKRLASERVSISSVVPTLLQFLIDADENINALDLSRLRFLICGAGTLSVALAIRFQQRFGVKIVHGYGLSEVTAYACHLPVDLTDAEQVRWLSAFGYPSIGCPFGANEMAIFDAEGEGLELAEGERGEIAIRGHNVMKYYFQRPDANRETFRYGWFRSGDEGFFRTDAQGRRFFFITGRLKELVNRGGVKFSPFDIEEVLLEIPGVRIGLAIAFENVYFGEEIGAYIVAAEGISVTEEQILNHCRRRLGFEKSPKVVVFGDEVPATATGKYQRLKLKPLFEKWKGTQFRAEK